MDSPDEGTVGLCSGFQNTFVVLPLLTSNGINVKKGIVEAKDTHMLNAGSSHHVRAPKHHPNLYLPPPPCYGAVQWWNLLVSFSMPAHWAPICLRDNFKWDHCFDNAMALKNTYPCKSKSSFSLKKFFPFHMSSNLSSLSILTPQKKQKFDFETANDLMPS